MLDLLQSTRINSDASEEDLKPGEYRDALNISMIANEVGAWTKGTTYANLDTNIRFLGLRADAICLGSAIDTSGKRIIVAFYQRGPLPITDEYKAVLDYAASRGFQLPTPDVQLAQNLLLTLLKSNGLWVKLDTFMCFLGDGDENFAKINWKNPSDATNVVNTNMVYAANSGFKANGISSFLNTKFNPSLGTNYQSLSALLIIGYEELYVNANATEGVFIAGNRSQVTPYHSLNTVRGVVNGMGEGTVTNVQLTDAPGLLFMARSSSSTVTVRKNSSSMFTMSLTITSRPNGDFYLGAFNTGAPTLFTNNRYSMFAAGDNLNPIGGELTFNNLWTAYKASLTSPGADGDGTVQEVLMYLLEGDIKGDVRPLIKSSLLNVSERSYLDGYSFVDNLFFFNFRESAPKVINIDHALSSPGFYDTMPETSLAILKPHPPLPPVAVRATGSVVNSPIQKKPFQFMTIYKFIDGGQSTKSPVSVYLNSLDDRDSVTGLYDHINVTITFPVKDYSIVKEVELFVRNNNNIADWRSVVPIKKDLFTQVGNDYVYLYGFYDNIIGNFYPLELSTKINDSIPQQSNYLAFIESRIFLIDSLLDYDFTSTFQIKLITDVNPNEQDDRLDATLLYTLTELEFDAEYTVGLSFYDRFGRKYPSSLNNTKLTTKAFTPVALPASDMLPKYTSHNALGLPKNTAQYELRAAGNIANWGKPPSFAHWWGFIRSKNTKWEFQQSIQCLLRFPYQLTKWNDTDPTKFPDVAGGGGTTNLFLEDGYLYWHPEKLLYGTDGTGLALTTALVNDYIDIVVPPNFPYPLDKNVIVDFMYKVTTDVINIHVELTNREVIETFANKIRVRGDRKARWFSKAGAGIGQFKFFPKFTTGVNLEGVLATGKVLTKDETTFPLVLKRRRRNDLESTLLYDTPTVFPVNNPGTKFATFQQAQSVTITTVEYSPLFIAPILARTLAQGDILLQPVNLAPTSAATNHRIKITWGPNTPTALRLGLRVSIWQLNDSKQPVVELYAATGDENGEYRVGNNETIEYLINKDAELVNGWYAYGIQILPAPAADVQFENPNFDLRLAGWLQSPEGLPDLLWKWASVEENFAYTTIASMNGGFSKTIYQLLNKANKDDIQIEVVVEGEGVVGPEVVNAVIQYPGSAQLPPVNNASESLAPLSRKIVPYLIDCDGPTREITLNTLTYIQNSIAPAGSFIRAEIWRVDQVTKRPISRIEGSEGAMIPLPAAPGTYVIPFGTANVIDTTGWYGIAVYFEGPSYADFTDKSYSNGATAWTVKAGSPPWVFQPDTNVAAIYQDVTFSPDIGASLGSKPMNVVNDILTPIFLPTGSDPAGYDNHRIIIPWGDNVNNGWAGKTITISLYELDQVTKRPLTYVPAYSAPITIGSNGAAEYFLVATKLLGNKWYGLGVTNPTGHTQINGAQFANNSFKTNITGWSLTAAVGGGSWAWNAGNAQFTSAAGGTFDTGIIYQTLNGFVQVVIPYVSRGGNTYTSISVSVTLNGVVKQTIDLTAAFAAGTFASVVFEPFASGSGNVGIKFSGVAPAGYSLLVSGIYNSFNANLYCTPKFSAYAISNVDNESWFRWAGGDFSTSLLDYKLSEAYTYWKKTATGQTLSTAVAQILEGDDGVATGIYLNITASASNTTDLIYSELNMQDAPVMDVGWNIGGYATIPASGAIKVQIWLFNDPSNFTAGFLLYEASISTTGVWSRFGTTTNVPGGYRYIGFRGIGTAASQFKTATINSIEIRPKTAYSSWVKNGNTINFKAKSREQLSAAYTIAANFHTDNLAPSATSALMGQDNLSGLQLKANIELFTQPVFINGGFENSLVPWIEVPPAPVHWTWVAGAARAGMVGASPLNGISNVLYQKVPLSIGQQVKYSAVLNATSATQQFADPDMDIDGGWLNIDIGGPTWFLAVYGDYQSASLSNFATFSDLLRSSNKIAIGVGVTIRVTYFVLAGSFNADEITLNLRRNSNVMQQVALNATTLNVMRTIDIVTTAAWAATDTFELDIIASGGKLNFDIQIHECRVMGASVAPVTLQIVGSNDALAWDVVSEVVSSNLTLTDQLSDPAVAAYAYTGFRVVGVNTNLTQQIDVSKIEVNGTSSVPVNDYDLIVSDSSGFELGRTSVIGQALDTNPQITVNVVNAPSTTGLYFSIQNKNLAGNISARIRQITNVQNPITIGADNAIADAKTWQIDSSNDPVELTTTTATLVDATERVPGSTAQITIVLADELGNEISAQQTFPPNAGPVTLLFTPTLQVEGNYNYGVKFKNNVLNEQVSGLIKIHSIKNTNVNASIVNIIANTIDPANLPYEAWKQFALGAFAKAGYVSNFIAVVEDLAVSAGTPLLVTPTSYHLVANIVPEPVPNHSIAYAPPDSTYLYGIAFPSIGSDPDAAGIVYIEKTGQSIGDINLIVNDLTKKSNSNVVRWGDPVTEGTSLNDSGSFSEGNKYIVDFQRGPIQVMIAMHDHTLFCVHEFGMSSLYVNRSTMISPSEVQGQGDELFLTNKVIGNDNKLTSNLGTVNPESCMVVESGSLAYGFDLIRKSFWQKSNNGVRNLTYECNAKNFFNDICFYRAQAYLEGEDIKIYSGYNEKQKSFYLTFAPFIFRGQKYPAITVAYNAYIDGFLSRYSFEPISYLATEDVLHSVKARELSDPDFSGSFSHWLQSTFSGGSVGWGKMLAYPGSAVADTTVPLGARLLNPDFELGAVNWTQYGGGTAWVLAAGSAEATIPAAGSSQHLVNTNGAIGLHWIRLNARTPVAGLSYQINVYDNAGVVLESLTPVTLMTGDEIVQVSQSLAGRIGVVITNASGAPVLAHLNLFSTVVKTYILYQPLPLAVEDVQIRLTIPARTGSMKLLVYAFDDPQAPIMTLLQTVDLIENHEVYDLTVNVPNTVAAKYVGFYTITDYDVTLMNYFNVNSVPSVWVHPQSGRANNFFGVQYDSMIDLLFNVADGQIRIFNSLGIISESAWSVETFSTSGGQLSMLAAENFRLRDGIYSAAIMRDILTPQDSLPDPVNNTPLMHGAKMMGDHLRIVLRNSETLRRIELKAVYLGSDELAGNFLGKK